MNAMSERDFHLLADAVRRRRTATTDQRFADELEQHAFRTMSYVDDLAEGESVNGMDYQIVRAAAILHDVSASKTRSHVSAEASATIAAEMLDSMGVDETFSAAVERAVLRHAPGAIPGAVNEDNPAGTIAPETCAELLVHDACLLARIGSMRSAEDDRSCLSDMRKAAITLRTKTAQRIGDEIIGSRERTTTTA